MLVLGDLDIGEEFVQVLRELAIAAGAHSLLEHAGDESIPRLATRLCSAIDG